MSKVYSNIRLFSQTICRRSIYLAIALFIGFTAASSAQTPQQPAAQHQQKHQTIRHFINHAKKSFDIRSRHRLGQMLRRENAVSGSDGRLPHLFLFDKEIEHHRQVAQRIVDSRRCRLAPTGDADKLLDIGSC